jgi:hypothetical protein
MCSSLAMQYLMIIKETAVATCRKLKISERERNARESFHVRKE